MARTRKIATIMFTDIQGYTALMQRDEAEGIRTRDRHRRIFQPITEANNGVIIQYFGDGTLSVFDEALDAVRCGIALQAAFNTPPCIPVRIGIHRGNIVLDEFDIIGDAVNIAAHVETLACVGSVILSRAVVECLPTECGIGLTSLGAFQLKNDAQIRELFAVRSDGVYTPKSKEIDVRREIGARRARSRRRRLSLLGLEWFFTL